MRKKEQLLENLLIYVLNFEKINLDFWDKSKCAEIKKRFMHYYDINDRESNTNHIQIINKIYSLDFSANNLHTTISELGISARTYYRYRNNYINQFEEILKSCTIKMS